MKLPIPANTMWRLVGLAAGGLVFTLLVPLPGVPVADSGRAAAAIAVFGIGLVFFVQATARRRRLRETVAFELNKLRRIYHLGRNMAAADERLRPWFTELHGHLLAYLSSFGGRDFARYEESNGLFRRLSYHAYTVPGIEGGKQELLYADLLRTTGDVAEARQRIVEARDSRLTAYGWTVFLLAVAASVLVTLESAPDRMADRLIAGASIVLALLLVDLLWEVDSLEEERAEFPRRYADNIARLEMRRED
jgi:hypothetical protein